MDGPANTRKLYTQNEGVLLRAIADVTQKFVGEAINHDASFVSRFLKGEKGTPPQKVSVEEMLGLLEAANLKLVPASDDEVCISRMEYESLKLFARKGLDSQ